MHVKLVLGDLKALKEFGEDEFQEPGVPMASGPPMVGHMILKSSSDTFSGHLAEDIQCLRNGGLGGFINGELETAGKAASPQSPQAILAKAGERIADGGSGACPDRSCRHRDRQSADRQDRRRSR